MREKITKRPLLSALVAFASVVVIALVVITVHDADQHDYPQPEQPDPAIAQQIATGLEQQPGVSSAEVMATIECIDRCKGQRPKYTATVLVSPDVTAEQIVGLVATHDLLAADKLPKEFSALSRELILKSDDQHSLTIQPLHDGFAANHAKAFLDARPAPNLLAWYGAYAPNDPKQSVDLVMLSSIEVDSCDQLDAAMAPAVQVLPAAAQVAEIAGPLVQFTCPGANGNVFLTTTATATTGWSALASALAGFRSAYSGPRPDVVVQDLYIAESNYGKTTVTAEVNTGKELSATGKAQLDAIAAQLTALGALDVAVEVKQF